MTNKFILVIVLLTLGLSFKSQARLEFDSEFNNIKLYGPYVKYNILKEPYSLGRFQFDLNDIRLEVEQQEQGGSTQVFALWPRFLMDFGDIQLIGENKRILLEESFSKEKVGEDQKYGRYKLEDGGTSLLANLDEPFQICFRQIFEKSKVLACSHFMVYKEGQFTQTFQGNNKSVSKLNGKKAPKNAQISLADDQKTIELELKFKSGFQIHIKDIVRRIAKENVVVDPREKRLGIIDGTGSVRPTELTTKDHIFSFIREKNYFKNQYSGSKDWPQDLEDAQMEFAPYLVGASIQLYGLILPKVPPPFEFKLNPDIAIATYAKNVELTGTKAANEVLAAKKQNELFISNDNEKFLWNFPAEKKGEINKHYISLQHDKKDFFFSKRIFRAHQTSLAGSLAVSTSQTLTIVPGYNFAAEHWFEELWNKSKYSFQRWGLAANIFETVQGFKPTSTFDEKYSINPIHFDLLFRLTPGVRPVQSTFGIGLRYLNFTLFRSTNPDLQTQMLGIGGFWQTAPQKIVDDIFNIVPFFRYPKWMELSFFYYPLLIGNQQLGFSFSWQVRGKMFFSKRWYIDTSFNVNSVSFAVREQTTVNRFGLGTAHGTIGLGYLF